MIGDLGWTPLFRTIAGMHEPERLTKADSILRVLV